MGKARGEGNIIVAGVLGLLLGKVLIAVDGGGDGKLPVVEEMVGHVCELVLFLLGKGVGTLRVGRKARNVESRGARGGGVGKIGRADTACAEPVEERGTVIVLGA